MQYEDHPFAPDMVARMSRLDRRLFIRRARSTRDAGQYEMAYFDEDGIECVALGPFSNLDHATLAELVLRMPWRHNRTIRNHFDELQADLEGRRAKERHKGVRRLSEQLADDTFFLSRRGDTVLKDYIEEAKKDACP